MTLLEACGNFSAITSKCNQLIGQMDDYVGDFYSASSHACL